jgi:O-antigen/teichoic acid export membrane protein
VSRLSKNILYNFVGQGLVLILGFVAVKYVFTRLGEDALGILYFTLTLSTVLSALLEMGVCSTVVREVSASFQTEPVYIRALIRTASLFYWGAYLLLAVGIYFVAPFLVQKWIHLKTMDVPTATWMLQILGMAALISLPRSLYTSLFRGLERMEFNNVIDVIALGAQQSGMVILLISGASLFPVVYWLAISFGLHILLYIFVSARFFSWRALIPGYAKGVILRNRAFSVNMMSISILGAIHSQSDKVIVSKLLPIGTFGVYGFASGAVSRLMLLTNAISQAAFPSFSGLFQAGDRSTMIAQYRKLHDLLCFATVPLFAVIPFASLPLFRYLFNEEIASMLLTPITFLSVGTYMNGTLNVPYFFSLAVGKSEISVKSNFYALFIVLPATGFLVYFFGLTGAGFSWVFYHLFAYSYAVPRICAECLEISASAWYRHILKIFILVAETYGGAWVVITWFGAYTIQALGVAYGVATLAFLIGSYYRIDSEVRAILLQLPRQLKMSLVERA